MAGWLYLIVHSLLALMEQPILRLAAVDGGYFLACYALPLFKLKGVFSLLVALMGFALFRRKFLKRPEAIKAAAAADAPAPALQKRAVRPRSSATRRSRKRRRVSP
jgi:hypothetical protein